MTPPSISVLETPGIAPLELWDAVVDGRTLFERRAEPSFYEALARAVAGHDIGRAAARVAIVGGGADRVRAGEAFRATLAIVDDDPFLAASSARALADAVVDAGQTSIKAIGPRGRVRVERRGATFGSDLPRPIARLLEAVVEGGSPIDVVLALPCTVTEIEGRILLGESSYPTQGDAQALVERLVELSATPIASVRLVNDAVLAARAVRTRLPPSSERTLVLTIGHGVGAALLEGAAP